MNPMQSQTRNWFLFFGLFFALMLGHTWLRNKIGPGPKNLTADQELAVVDLSRLMAGYSGSGLVDSYRFAVEAAAKPEAFRQYAIAVREAKDNAAAVAKAAPPKPVEPA